MSAQTLIRKPLFWLYTGGGILLLLGLGLWFTKLSTDPERIFWNMIEQSLATRAVTIEATQDSNGGAVHQIVQYSLGANSRVHSLTAISQPGTKVRNEMLATPTADYTRYMSVQTDQKGPTGKALNFSKIIGVWAKDEAGGGRLLPQAVLGMALPMGGMTIPIGQLDPEARAQLVQQIRDDHAYTVAFKSVKKEKHAGRQVYVYNVSIQPVAYAALIKQFAHDVGLSQLNQLDPNSYRGQQPMKLELSVDVRSGRLVRAALPAANYVQTYTSYDVPIMTDLPAKPISAAELQKRLSEL